MSVSNISSLEAWDSLQQQGGFIIDVRTQAEWMFVGVPDTATAKITPIFLEWQSLPNMQVNAQFPQLLQHHLQELGADLSTNLFFLCRSGQRSLSAAQVMNELGYENCFNISDGFEGPLNAERHRGHQAGWKASGLPWVQS
jgi:rhodanese-related sulfurtransferase